MNEIPEDVMKQAREIFLALPKEGAAFDAIASAIMAERERATKIMNARLPLYLDIGQKNAIRECISSVRDLSEEG